MKKKTILLESHKWLYEKCLNINNLLKTYKFPCHVITNHTKNYDVDIIVIDNVDTLIHYKSSNWTLNDQYMIDKKISLFNFLNIRNNG